MIGRGWPALDPYAGSLVHAWLFRGRGMMLRAKLLAFLALALGAGCGGGSDLFTLTCSPSPSLTGQPSACATVTHFG